MEATAIVFANEFIRRAKNDPIITLTPMKLQKLLYYFYGYCRVECGRKPFNEDFQGWQFGPVLLSVYYEFQAFRTNNITKYATDAMGDVYFIDPSDKNSREVLAVLDEVWDKYQNYGAIQLSEMTHQPNTPWSKAVRNGASTLSDDDIVSFFTEELNGKR